MRCAGRRWENGGSGLSAWEVLLMIRSISARRSHGDGAADRRGGGLMNLSLKQSIVVDPVFVPYYQV